MEKQNKQRSILDTCGHWMYWQTKVLIYCALLSLGAMTILIAMQVISRNFMNIGLPWADELARLTGLILVFFTIPYLQLQGKHIAVDMLSSRLKGVVALISRCVNELAVLAFFVLLVMSFLSYLERAGHFSTPAMGMSNWLFYGPAFIGIISCTLVTTYRLIAICTGRSLAPSTTAASLQETILIDEGNL